MSDQSNAVTYWYPVTEDLIQDSVIDINAEVHVLFRRDHIANDEGLRAAFTAGWTARNKKPASDRKLKKAWTRFCWAKAREDVKKESA